MAINFSELLQRKHDWAIEHKKSGGPVVGCYPGIVPEEILWACGVLPVQLLMQQQSSYFRAEEHLPTYVCDCARSMLAQKLDGGYQYLDGLLAAHVCGTVNGLAGIWDLVAGDSFVHVFTPPMSSNPAARTYLKAELLNIAERLAELGAKPLTEENLGQAIAIFNLNRRLIKQIYEMRAVRPDVVRPDQVLSAVLTGMFMPKPLHNEMLQKFIQSVEMQTPAADNGAARIILVGLSFENEVSDNKVVLSVLESSGAVVVWDDLASGMRYRANEVDENQAISPLDRLVESFMGPPPIQIRRSVEVKANEVLAAAHKYGAQGVLCLVPKYCDPILFDIPDFKHVLMQNGLRTLVLEMAGTLSEGALKTRVEGFLEMLNNL